MITAAKCVSVDNPDNSDVDIKSLSLGFGMNEINLDTILETILGIQRRTIKNIYIYDTFSYPAAKDGISVIELSKPVELGGNL